MNEEFLFELSKLRGIGESFVVATLVYIQGSVPQEPGARIIVGSHGLLYGTVGGGKLETKAIEVAQEMLTHERRNHFVEWNLQSELGMTCGGVAGLFFEKTIPHSDWKIAVFGAGHIAQELVRLLIKLDCEVFCIDPRFDWLDKLPEHNRLKKIPSDDMKSVLKTLPANTFIVSLTMGHAFDLPIINEALKEFNFPYVGAIGSESKARALKLNLKESGVDEKLIAKLHCPIGEAFGNNQPVEISISIISQLIRFRDGRKKANMECKN